MDKKEEEVVEETAQVEEKYSDIEVLKKEFPSELVKKRMIMRGEEVKEIEYVPGSHIIARLNEVYGTNWSFNIIDRIVDFSQKQVAVCGMLKVPSEPGEQKSEWIEKQQWGGVSINTYNNGRVVCLGDDLKIATTDALKKCATLLGVGLYLYDQDNELDNIKLPIVEVSETTKDGEKSDPISAVQIEGIKKIIQEHGFDEEEVKKYLLVDKFESLTSSEAAKFLIQRHKFWQEFANKDKQ
ncbi:MAG: RAD52 family DNA repair protein [Melioribacteraceae bacterium]|nr:RAD52 family DNA repair protein [Melioribacteraceae bacterium]